MKKNELTELGISEETADKVLAIHGKDIEKHKQRAEDAESARDTFKAQAETIQKTLDGTLARFEGLESAEAVNKEIAGLKADIEANKTKYEKDIAQRDQNKWLNEKLDEYGVSSQLARKAIINDCTGDDSPLKWNGSQFYGFGDYMAEQKKVDNSLYQTAEEKAAAEAAKSKEDNPPSFAHQTGGDGKESKGYIPPVMI